LCNVLYKVKLLILFQCINYSNIVPLNHTSNNKINEVICIKHDIKKRDLNTIRLTPSQMVSPIMHNISGYMIILISNKYYYLLIFF